MRVLSLHTGEHARKPRLDPLTDHPPTLKLVQYAQTTPWGAQNDRSPIIFAGGRQCTLPSLAAELHFYHPPPLHTKHTLLSRKLTIPYSFQGCHTEVHGE